MHSIWSFTCPNDGYFAGIVIAQSADEARQRAWELHGAMDAHVIRDGVVTSEIDPKKFGARRTDCVESSDDYQVDDLGTEYVGADGEGNIEIK